MGRPHVGASGGGSIEPAPVRALQGGDGSLSSLLLDDGRTAAIDALFLAPRSQLNSPIAERLGCAQDDGPLGKVIRTDAAKLTTIPGVYAAGDFARVPHNVSWATAAGRRCDGRRCDGVTAGISLHQSLVFEPVSA